MQFGGSMKVIVYAICKNEEKFAARWVESMKEADEIYVLDTGSRDNTVKYLTELGVKVKQEEIIPWRFDNARNKSLEMVPDDADICVCTDLDEVFHPGWRGALEKAWVPGTQQARYRYTWNFNSDGSEGYVFWIEKIHARHGFVWKHPVHEVITYTGEGSPSAVYAPGVQLDHHADQGKSRGQYLPLLEQSVAEEPEDDRNVHYLGREYMYKGRWQDCIDTLRYHLTLKTATWADERCASMRYIAESYKNLGDGILAESWFLRACGEAGYLREPWIDYAKFLYERGDWHGLIFACDRALGIKDRPKTYISEAESWGSLPYDLISLGYYFTGDLKRALYFCGEALKISPDDGRIAKKLQYIQNRIVRKS